MERKQIAWNIYLMGKKIDTVYYDKNCDSQYVKESLINHDGYHPNIEVKKDYWSN